MPKAFVICALGDVIGDPGMTMLERVFGRIGREHDPDMVVVNGENAAPRGRGLTQQAYKTLTTVIGCDVVTMGNHWCDHKDILKFLPHTQNVVLPGNMRNVPGLASGLRIVRLPQQPPVAVMNLLARVFMGQAGQEAACPFQSLQQLLEMIPKDVRIRILDIHGEATSEKQALAWYGATKLSFIWGSHTHVPTADVRILSDFTGYISDLGMVGGYESVIGFDGDRSLERFISPQKKGSSSPACTDLRLYGAVAHIHRKTGARMHVERIEYT